MTAAESRSWWWLLPWLVAGVVACALLAILAWQRAACDEAGGRLEFSLTSRIGAECVRNGSVIHP